MRPSPETLAEMERHVEFQPLCMACKTRCDVCSQPWPCTKADLLASTRALERVVEAARDNIDRALAVFDWPGDNGRGHYVDGDSIGFVYEAQRILANALGGTS